MKSFFIKIKIILGCILCFIPFVVMALLLGFATAVAYLFSVYATVWNKQMTTTHTITFLLQELGIKTNGKFTKG